MKSVKHDEAFKTPNEYSVLHWLNTWSSSKPNIVVYAPLCQYTQT